MTFRRFLVGLLMPMLSVSVGLATASPAKATSTPGYLTLSFGRMQWVTTDKYCNALPNTVEMSQVVQEFQNRGLIGTGSVVGSRTAESTFTCWSGYTKHPSWEALQNLQNADGWHFFSGGLKYRNMTLLSPSEQWNESCGSLLAFTDHGLVGAEGLFAYPNNKWTSTIQSDVVSTCFDYGRTYAGGRNYRDKTVAPWFQRTVSVNGGKCNNSSLPCYNLTSTPRRYRSPSSLAALANVGTDQWVVIQTYRFVVGSSSGKNFSWDCTSPDWRNHWSNNAELYCWSDYLTVLDAIPPGVVVTDPATVAAAWGRSPG
jgi:hypothetical protein